MISGFLQMMQHEGLSPVTYRLAFTSYEIITKKEFKSRDLVSDFKLNDLLGKKVRLTTNGEIRCVDCGKLTKKSFNQGSCYSCFIKLASNDLCIMRPESCHFHLGTCREPDWGKKYCFQKHIVYLANTSGLKVGITKEQPFTKRWVDQGAMYAIPILEVVSRKDSGLLEVEFGKYLSDKTSWQTMISSDSVPLDLVKTRGMLLEKIDPGEHVDDYKIIKDSKTTEIKYPILKYPKKKVSLKLDKDKPIEDTLLGIKGQYILFESGAINIRAFGGYQMNFEIL